MPVTHFTKYDDLLAYLVENNVPHDKQPDNQAVSIPVAPPVGGYLYARWEKALPYIQIILPFLPDVPEARIPEIEAAICRTNTAIPLPGFGYEYDKKFVYMRLCLPVYDGVPATTFQKQVLAVIQNAKEFREAFADVARGKPGKDVVELAVAHNRPS